MFRIRLTFGYFVEVRLNQTGKSLHVLVMQYDLSFLFVQVCGLYLQERMTSMIWIPEDQLRS